jgi:hypothetical protein
MSTSTIPLFDRSSHPFPIWAGQSAARGTVEEAACGTGEAGAKRPRRR